MGSSSIEFVYYLHKSVSFVKLSIRENFADLVVVHAPLFSWFVLFF